MKKSSEMNAGEQQNEVPKWVAVYTRNRSERLVAKRLVDMEMETYVPMRKEKHHWSDRIKMVDVPLFKSYVFVKMPLNKETYVRETPGVVMLVKFGQKLSIIPESQIQMIRQLESGISDLYVYETTHLKRGATVTILEGRFAGMEGTIVSGCKDGNFSVDVKGLNLSVVVALDKHVLELAQKREVEKSKYNF